MLIPDIAIKFTIFFKRSINPEIVKNIARCNFLSIIVMYIKVYISGIEMSQRIHFWYQIWPKMLIFWENGKKHFFGRNKNQKYYLIQKFEKKKKTFLELCLNMIFRQF